MVIFSITTEHDGMKNNHCFRQTIVFVLGLIIGGALISPLSGIDQAVIVLITGMAFYLTQKVPFSSSTKQEVLNKVL
jgi:hypothetical protein